MSHEQPQDRAQDRVRTPDAQPAEHGQAVGEAQPSLDHRITDALDAWPMEPLPRGFVARTVALASLRPRHWVGAGGWLVTTLGAAAAGAGTWWIVHTPSQAWWRELPSAWLQRSWLLTAEWWLEHMPWALPGPVLLVAALGGISLLLITSMALYGPDRAPPR